MMGLTVRHWFSLLWERPVQVLLVNFIVLFLLGIGFGILGALNVTGPFFLLATLGSTALTLLYWGGIHATAAEARAGQTWKFSRPWQLVRKGLPGMGVSAAWGLVVFLIWQVSLPAYLQKPDYFPPENPTPVSVVLEGERYRISWQDPKDADLSALVLEWEGPGGFGRVDPGIGSFLVPAFEESLDLTLRAEDLGGRRSEGIGVSIRADGWEFIPVPEGVRGKPELQVSGIGTGGFNLDWNFTVQEQEISRGGRFRVLSADTQDGLPDGVLDLKGSTRVFMDWSEGVRRRHFQGLDIGGSGWYQVQVLWPDGSLDASEPIFVTTLGYGNLAIAGILVAVLVWGLLTLPFWLPWKNQTGKSWMESLKESQTFALRNLLFVLGCGAAAVVWLIASAFLLTTFPGLFGLSLWYEEALRMRLKAAAWFAENPEADPRRAPWNLIFAEEKEHMKGRGIRGLFTPWR